jgi:protein-S-isoprenylcysteine O-methyltransferase Ste14
MHMRALIVVLLVCAPAVVQAQKKDVRAERFETELELLQDGSLLVRESITFRFTGDTFSEVTRTVPHRRTDGVIDVQAFLDGQLLPEGRDENTVRLDRRRRELRVRWQFPESIDVSRVFTLSYRVMGALRVEPERLSLAWDILPTRHDYVIDQASLLLTIPDSATTLGGPELEATGWGWTQEGERRWRAVKSGLVADETAVLRESYARSGFAVSVPAWQALQERTRELAPAFVVGAGVILVFGAGILGMTRLRYHVPRVDPKSAVPAARNALSPAMGTALTGMRISISPLQVSATLFDLLSRKVLTIEESSPATGKGDTRTFTLIMPPLDLGARARVRPHEEVVLDSLWMAMKQGRVDLQDAQKAVLTSARYRLFKQALARELVEAGFVDDERRSAARELNIAGGTAVVLGIVGIGVAAWLIPRMGEAVPLVPFAVVIVGAMCLIAGSAFPVLSQTGAAVSAQWGARVRALRASAKQGPSAEEVDTWLPVAVGAGLGTPFAKSGVAVSWLAGMNDPAAILPIIVATTAASTASAGSSAGAVGGGGFSGAR